MSEKVFQIDIFVPTEGEPLKPLVEEVAGVSIADYMLLFEDAGPARFEPNGTREFKVAGSNIVLPGTLYSILVMASSKEEALKKYHTRMS